ncbi:MAG: metallophosphoesterase [Clostridia bacterium]|nr:metallophosphoesterase [Clostridia bacterium]
MTHIRLISDTHNCHLAFHGSENNGRLDAMTVLLQAAEEMEPSQGTLVLGDVSLDHWGWNEGGSRLWNPPVSRTAEFCARWFPALPAPAYILPGNHEQYGPAEWLEITGQPRMQAVVLGDLLFILCDAFRGNLDPVENSDGTYLPMDCGWIREMLTAYPAKPAVLCAHYFDFTKETEEFIRLVREESRILVLAAGHTHHSSVLPAGDTGKVILQTGNFSYSGMKDPRESYRGWRELWWDGIKLTSWYAVQDGEGVHNGTSFTVQSHRQDFWEGSFPAFSG